MVDRDNDPEQKPRTGRQNNSAHLLNKQLADELNDQGKYMMKVLRHDAEIEWTPVAVKEYLVRPFMKAMYGKTSTTQLTTKELSKVYEAMLDHVANVTGVALDFPSSESLQAKSAKERVWK